MRIVAQLLLLFCLVISISSNAQHDTMPHPVVLADSVASNAPLRIINLNPYFTIHSDSTLSYNLEINKDEKKYYWFLRNSPIGMRINKDDGTVTFRAEKSFFLSGKLKYDVEYKVNVGVQNLSDPIDRADTFFTIVFYNTDIIVSKVKPTVSSTLTVDEGDTVSFKVQCDNGSFPIESITFFANRPLKNFTLVKKCDDDFTWMPPFDFVKESDSAKIKIVLLSFVGVNKFQVRDTATVRLIVRDALNYPLAEEDYKLAVKNVNTYVLTLKYAFVQLDKSVKSTKSARTSFDITGSTTALTGSILASSANTSTQKVGQVLPGVGISLVPIKEAVAPQKVFDPNQASLVRGAIKRLDYMVRDNALVGERDPDITRKTAKLKEELKQAQIQLIDVPIDPATNNMTEEQLNQYFSSPRVSKKYRTKK